MSDEEIKKIVELFDKGYCNECNELNCLGGEPSSKNVSNAIRQLQQENKQLKERIDKAIEYIEKNNLWSSKETENGYSYMKNECRDLLSILQDKE